MYFNDVLMVISNRVMSRLAESMVQTGAKGSKVNQCRDQVWKLEAAVGFAFCTLPTKVEKDGFNLPLICHDLARFLMVFCH